MEGTLSSGANYGVLSARNSALIYCDNTAIAPDGPYRDRPGFDILSHMERKLRRVPGKQRV